MAAGERRRRMGDGDGESRATSQYEHVEKPRVAMHDSYRYIRHSKKHAQFSVRGPPKVDLSRCQDVNPSPRRRGLPGGGPAS